MLIIPERKYMQQHVIGGSGIFSTVSDFFKKLATSNAAKSAAAAIAKASRSDIGKTAVAASKEIATTAINTGKDIAAHKIKQLANKKKDTDLPASMIKPAIDIVKPILTEVIPQVENKQKAKELVQTLVHSSVTPPKTESFNANKYLARGVKSNAISIQDHVKQLNGRGLVRI